VRVLLTDDHRLFASALQSKLEHDPRFDVVGVASGGADAVRLAEEVSPDIVLLDAGIPELDTLAATRLISSGEGSPRVLIMAGSETDLDAVEAHDAGAAAFLRKPRTANDLLETLELTTILITAAVAPPEEAPG
jgi:DNA-binding NarL/FixJ family response regulator